MARSLCLLIFFIKFSFSSEEFIFWAKLSSQNNIIISQEIAFSKAMTRTKSSSLKFLCQIDGVKDENTTAEQFLNLYKDKVFDCFLGTKVGIFSEFKNENNIITQTSDLKIYPINFIIEFKPNSAIIGVFK
ncbi:hypothetical protein KDE13_01150 [Campylobacter sp. faydin G-140]|uniref:hypothetical protein n=1 Tax=Campylobacter anatolicus TaxID=2829105 RepID=UPI001B9CA027|nr:hypothetical protein [Campylobacter anatolicus]MBR8461941.1 hypothetical protein [Campylobacter anatolicus]MBR8464969.1 hypothetical protein [Campylobacter anatolicus]